MRSNNKNIISVTNSSDAPNNTHHNIMSRLLCASAAFVLTQASSAYANPSGGQVVAGSASFSTPNTSTLVVNQGTDKAIINWQNFDILSGETTQFVQPSSNSVALNRITSGDATQILGNLSANGKLMVVNPNGVFFGSNSKVDAAGLIASTADTSDADFLAGKINLSIAGKPDAAIINKGTITVTDGGLAALVAPSVQNDGVIQANMGTVALASADTASIDFYGDNLYSFALDKETTAAAQGSSSAVSNSGIVSVGGGKVVLTAKVAKDVVDNVINNTGIIEASSAYMDGGTIVLDGGSGDVLVGGTLNASGNKGGSVTVSGENIKLVSADINAGGKNGGGTVKIGGDYQGGGTIPHAKSVNVDENSKIDVSASDSGNGGLAVIWSDEVTDFNGKITGTGGLSGGNGATAEVSSKGELGYNGVVDLHADNGESGTLLLDPNSLFIGDFTDHFWSGDHFINVAPLVTTLNSGTNVTAAALNNVSVLKDMVWNGSGSFTINAGNVAIIEADIKAFFNGTSTQGAVTINSAKLQMGAADIWTRKGDINVNTGRVDMSYSTIKSALGNVIINNSGRFGTNTANVLAGKTVTLHQDTTGFIQNAVDAVSNVGTGSSTILLGNGTWNEDVVIDGKNNMTLKGNGSLNTIINAPNASTNPVVSVSNTANVTISDLWVKGGEVGVESKDSYRFKLVDSIIFGASEAGVLLNNADESTVNGNYLVANKVGLNGSNSLFTSIQGNGFQSNETGIMLKDSTYQTIKYNAFYGTTGTGIFLDNVNGTPITDNLFKNTVTGINSVGGSAVFIKDNTFTNVGTGVKGTNTSGLVILSNDFNGGTEAVNNNGGVVTVSSNNITGFTNGVVVNNGKSTSVIDNNISNITGDAVRISNSIGTLVSRNNIDNADVGVNFAAGNYNGTVSNNIITNTDTGISITGGDLFWVQGNNISSSTTGLEIDDTNRLTVGGNLPSERNIFTDNFVGIYGQNSTYTKVVNNEFSDSVAGIVFDSDKWLTIRNNDLSNLFAGISLFDVVGSPITDNIFNDVFSGIFAFGGSSLVIDNNLMNNAHMGITSEGSLGISITNNQLFGDAGKDSHGIYVVDGLNSAVAGNEIDNFETGIGVEDSTHTSILSNLVTNTGDAGIFAENNQNTLIFDNNVDTAHTGIRTVSNTAITIDGNAVLNNLYGVVVENTNGAILKNNVFTDNGTAAAFYSSDNSTLTGDIFTGNILGIDLDDSQNTFIREATMVVPPAGIGMFIHNGSGGTLVRGLNIIGGGVGVLLDGAGSSMQFVGNTSSFIGQGQYFILQNNAMFGDTLDASQQFFGGVRASNFTLAQRNAAEGITVDIEDGIPTIGNVFYKDFVTSFALFGLDSIIQFRDFPSSGLFSYAGRTITNNPGQTPPQFDVGALSLSLLSPAAGGTLPPSGGAVNPAGLTPSQLGGLEPAAGGNSPQSLAALEPAAGGAPDCGNSFLGAGFNTGFDPATCSLKQQQ